MSPCSDSLSLRLPYAVKLATQRKSLTHYTKGTQSPLLEEPFRVASLCSDLLHRHAVFCRTLRASKNREDASSRGSHCLYACGFRIYFTPLPGFFSPFPHGTGSLSVDYEYLALEDGPPIFRQDFTCPALLVASLVPRSTFRVRGCHPLRPHFPERSTKSSLKLAGCSHFARHYSGNLG